jgi:hypothetical protein
MAHCDDESLVLLALDDTPLSPDQAAHLRQCDTCADELASLRSTVAIGRSSDPELELSAPGPAVWAAIQQQVTSNAAEVAAAETAGEAEVVPIRPAPSRTGRRWFSIAAAAVIGAVIGGGVVTATVALQQEPGQVTASAELSPVPGGPPGPQHGTASVQQTPAGPVLALDTEDLADPDGFYEVWLMDATTGGLIALGTVPGGRSVVQLPIPAGANLGSFSTVDVSIEPLDGNPKHSATSVLRGDLV